MMQVHTQGQAVCGTYTYEVAETKVETVREQAARERLSVCRPTSKDA